MKWLKSMAMPAKVAAMFALLANGAIAQQPMRIPATSEPVSVVVGAERTNDYLPSLAGKRVAIVTNQTGRIGHTHLVDSLLALNVNVVKVFAPEHGFRGDADAGEHVRDDKDKRTGVAVVSLYGDNKKPSPAQLAGVDVLLFDIQDVGVRFYTYISTLHYVMEACVEQQKKLIVLDRPDPNGFYVDGPVLDTAYASFVGMHPVPLVHGMTIGEYARMINGEGWLAHGVHCELTVVPCIGYDHATFYDLPVRPSPNLPNMSAVYLYPSLGLFEGTIVSVGRGTDRPFQCIGYPDNTLGVFHFTPKSVPGAKSPPYMDKPCTGMDLSEYGGFFSRLSPRVHLEWLIGMYQNAADKSKFFTPFFDKLAGSAQLKAAIQRGDDEERIRASWKPGIDAFRKVRSKYLLYHDVQ